MRRLLGLCIFVLMAALAGSAGSADPKSLLSHYLPSDVIATLDGLTDDQRSRVCQADPSMWFRLAAEHPEAALPILSSNQFSTQPLTRHLDHMGDISGLATSVLISQSPVQKAALIKLLAYFANAHAWEQTVDCSGGPYGECEANWTTKRGTEPSPSHSWGTTEIRLMFVAFEYYATLADFEPEALAAEHAAIQRWLGVFENRLPHNSEDPGRTGFNIGMGFDHSLWARMTFELVRHKEADFSKRLETIQPIFLASVADDGSFPGSTTRGSKATGYHQAMLNESYVTLEIFKAAGIDLYPAIGSRLEKAVKIYLDTIDDIAAGRNTAAHPATIYKWAKADFHSAGEPTVQQYDLNALTGDQGTSWMYIYLARHPETKNAARLRKLLAGYNFLPQTDGASGLNFGCIYRLMDSKGLKYEMSKPALDEALVAKAPDILGRGEATGDLPEVHIASIGIDPDPPEAKSRWYRIYLLGATANGRKLGLIDAGLEAGFKTKSRLPKDVEMLRFQRGTEGLRDKQSQDANYQSCGWMVPEARHLVYLYGQEGAINSCILAQMSADDGADWEALGRALPMLVHQAAVAGDPNAIELDNIFVAKLGAEAASEQSDKVVLLSGDMLDEPSGDGVTAARTEIHASFSDQWGDWYKVWLTGIKLGDTKITSLQQLDITVQTQGIKPVQLHAEGSDLHDPGSAGADFTTCGQLASNGTDFYLAYGPADWINDCVYAQMGPADRDKWQAIHAAIPVLIHDIAVHGNGNAPGADIAKMLDKQFAIKAKEKAKGGRLPL